MRNASETRCGSERVPRRNATTASVGKGVEWRNGTVMASRLDFFIVGCRLHHQNLDRPRRAVIGLPEQSDDFNDHTDRSEDQGEFCKDGALVPCFFSGITIRRKD